MNFLLLVIANDVITRKVLKNTHENILHDRHLRDGKIDKAVDGRQIKMKSGRSR